MQPAGILAGDQRPGHDQCRDGPEQHAPKEVGAIAPGGREDFAPMLFFATARQGASPMCGEGRFLETCYHGLCVVASRADQIGIVSRLPID